MITLATLVAGAAAGCRTGDDPEPAPAATSDSPSATPSATPEPDPTPVETPAEPAAEPAVNGPNSITSPLAGEQVSSPFTATGEGTAYEGTLSYRVVAAGTDTDTQEVVAEGWTQAGANGEVGPWSIELELDPGSWTLEVWEPSMSETEGGGASDNRVTVTFTVG